MGRERRTESRAAQGIALVVPIILVSCYSTTSQRKEVSGKKRPLLNLLHDTRSPIRTDLCPRNQSTHIKSQRYDGIASPLHALAHQPLGSIVPRGIHHVRKDPDLPTHGGSHEAAQVRAPVARSHGQSVDGAEDAHDAVAGYVVHGRGDDAVGVGEAGGHIVEQLWGNLRLGLLFLLRGRLCKDCAAGERAVRTRLVEMRLVAMGWF